jgi:hypothetical protein
VIDLLGKLDALKNEGEGISHDVIGTFESDNPMHEMTQVYQNLKDKAKVHLLLRVDI